MKSVPYSPTTGSIVAKLFEWHDQKEYGFLRVGKERVFLHCRGFDELYRRPVVGDLIRFNLGQDPQGRMCAQNAVFVRRCLGMIGVEALGLCGLLFLPIMAVLSRGVDFRWIAGYGVLLSGFTYGAYAWDKRRARQGGWRLAEARLHFLELLGGWPGALVAQRRLRHKCSKASYQYTFWLILLLHQFVAMDSLRNWQFIRALLNLTH